MTTKDVAAYLKDVPKTLWRVDKDKQRALDDHLSEEGRETASERLGWLVGAGVLRIPNGRREDAFLEAGDWGLSGGDGPDVDTL